MNRHELRHLFGVRGRPVVTVVIHALDQHQVNRNVKAAMHGGADGVFLINHDFERAGLIPIIEATRESFTDLWLGVNFLGVSGADAFPELAALQRRGIRTDAYWADDARIDERREPDDQRQAAAIDRVRRGSGWDGLYFGGTAFKKQRPVASEHHLVSSRIACNHMDVVTTSGAATGMAASIEKIRDFRSGCGDHALAVASGITPQNVAACSALIDCILIATGVNIDGDFYNVDINKLESLMNTLEIDNGEL